MKLFNFGKRNENEEGEKYIPTTQDHLAIDYIRSGVMKLKSGGYRLVVELPSVNIELMEGEEKEMVLQQYRQILGAIDFPFQYFQQSRIVDVSEYLQTIDTLEMREKNPLIQMHLRYYKGFLNDLIRERSVLTKNFYLTIPYDLTAEQKNKEKYDQMINAKNKKSNKKVADEENQEDDIYLEEQNFEKARKQLYMRGTMIERAFRRFDIAPRILNDEELLELFYSTYNKDRSVYQSLKHVNIDDFTTMRVKAVQRRGN